MGKRIIFVAVALFMTILTSVASAEVWFMSQPKTIYSLGDNLEISIAVSDVGKQIGVELFCTNRSKIIFLNYLSNKSIVDIFQPLTKDFLEDIKGQCEIVLEYGQDKEVSSTFVISDNVFIQVETDKQKYDPEEEVKIKGRAEKANTQLLEGFFEVNFPKLNLAMTGTVNKGKFETNITLPPDIDSGLYTMNITAYEKRGEERTNTGKTILSIKVKQAPKEVDIALENQEIKPGNNLSFKIMLYDQAGRKIEGDASFLIENANGETLMKELTKIDENKIFYIEKNLSFGYYKIKAYSFGLYGERQFHVDENEEAEFKIINNTLMVKNIGNVEYNNAVQVKIGSSVEIINDKLSINQEKKYQIKAPDGVYDVVVTDGSTSMTSEGISLTGNAIAIKELQKGFFSRNKILAWLFLILVMGMFIFVSARRVIKKKFTLSDKFLGKKEETKGGVVKVDKGKTKIIRGLKEAEHSLVLNGQKYNTALICLKTKNELSKTAKINMERILERVYNNKGVIYRTGNYIMPIFSPLVTKTFKNYVPAVKAALDMEKALHEHNKKFSDKINFGIAVHSGNLVSNLQENKLKFTSLGNTLSLAKRIADLSEREVLLSKDIHEKTISEIKADKQEKASLELFKVKNIVDNQRNQIFVQDFLKKLAEQKG